MRRPIVRHGAALVALGLLGLGADVSVPESPGPVVRGAIVGPVEPDRQALQRQALEGLAGEGGRLAARLDLARTRERQGRYREAVAAWRDVLRTPKKDQAIRGTAHARLAVDLYYTGDPRAAERHLAAAETLGFQVVPEVLRELLENKRPRHARVRTVSPAAAGLIVDPPVKVDTGGAAQAAETSVALAGSMELVAAWNDLREPAGVGAWSLGWGVSFDGGLTWTDAVLRPPGVPATLNIADPMTAYDPRTGNMWVGGSTFSSAPSAGNIFIARKPPGAAEIEPVVFINEGFYFDRGVLAVGPAPGNPDSTRLYVAHIQGLQWSDDLGATWSATVPLDPGAVQHPRMGPEGEVYVFYWDFGDRILLQRSVDGGVTVSDPILVASRLDTWNPQDGSRFPGKFRVAPLVFPAVDPNDGTLYCVYFDTTKIVDSGADVDLYFTRSTDRGNSWTSPVVISGDGYPAGDQFFPWLEADAQGRLHLLYFDSRNAAQADDVEDGLLDLYYSLSLDGGDSWTEVRLTASFGSAAAEWPGMGQFLGDFVGLSIAGDRVLAVYPATFDGGLDIYAQRIDVSGVMPARP